MGIRFKLLLTFVLSFGLLGLISLGLLQRSLNASYATIERNELASHMSRIVQSIEAELEHLNSLTRDWAVWTEMYRHVMQPDAAWESDNIGPLALDTAGLALVMVYDQQGQLVSFSSSAKSASPASGPPLARLQSSPYAALAGGAKLDPGCGLMRSEAGLMLTCLARISRSDSSGDFAGNLILARMFDDAMLTKLRHQTQLAIKLIARSEATPGMEFWPDFLPDSKLGPGNVWHTQEPKLYHLEFLAQDRLKRNVALLGVSVSRDVHEQGILVFQQVRRQLIWAGAFTASLLALAVHLLLVRRLRRFTRQLVELADAQTWNTRIKVKGKDELGLLSGHVNHLLSLIETQVQALQRLSLTDALTGLSNRRGFDERIAQELATKSRGERKLALLTIDVDCFKRYNDRYGHPAGDRALAAVAQVLGSARGREGDMAARIGGEEFALLLPETDAAGALVMAERIRSLMHELALPHEDSPIAPILTLSIGIAIAAADTPSTLIARADQALYQAKEQGRDRAVLLA
ncbi:diguanylate cyclase domain-containing protein [Roseateles oligotrophus]|uniref:diguanylate cyclase n=1 Tax=Roseateles oligotrophus TaxID=1769250 RepID=A0ABT2YKX2_9BURK|nr:diguanylate cyclase [Roseateles oligotrophus]MCV2370697.1 diguanylate cyclase [Roseateles oligotrophus]